VVAVAAEAAYNNQIFIMLYDCDFRGSVFTEKVMDGFQ